MVPTGTVSGMSCSHDEDPTLEVASSPVATPDIVSETLVAYGEGRGGVRFAHEGTVHSQVWVGAPLLTREAAEERLESLLAPGATRSYGAGRRPLPEEADPVRTAFQRDVDRIKHATCFRRLSAKTQVVLDAASINDHLRSRMTHSLEVAQVALGVGVPLGLNADLLEASALAHDVGHGPAGHASEEAFSPYLPGGYDHAVYGADVLLTELNFTLEVIDAVRNHSWRRPSPLTPEAHVVSWADRIAYVSHDFDDAVRGGIITPDELPQSVREFAGLRQSEQLRAFVTDMHASTASSGVVSMSERAASALDDFRRFNYERIYLRPASKVQAEKVILMLRELVDYFIDAPGKLHLEEGVPRPVSGSPEAAEAAVRYVSGMTDRFALSLAVNVLGWAPSALPRGV